MNIKTCKGCRKLFNYVVGPYYCPACKDALEKKYNEVKTYIRENANADINRIAEECEVDKAQIHQWIREERLMLSDNSSITLECELCGGEIRTGRFCNSCKEKLAGGLSNAIEKPKQIKPDEKRNQSRMRFLERK
ncbi:MAG: flagellar protein [Lachnospiraceae bacterium]